MELEKNNVRKHIVMTHKTLQELYALMRVFGEKRSRVVSRLINEAFLKLKDKDK